MQRLAPANYLTDNVSEYTVNMTYVILIYIGAKTI